MNLRYRVWNLQLNLQWCHKNANDSSSFTTYMVTFPPAWTKIKTKQHRMCENIFFSLSICGSPESPHHLWENLFYRFTMMSFWFWVLPGSTLTFVPPTTQENFNRPSWWVQTVISYLVILLLQQYESKLQHTRCEDLWTCCWLNSIDRWQK